MCGTIKQNFDGAASNTYLDGHNVCGKEGCEYRKPGFDVVAMKSAKDRI